MGKRSITAAVPVLLSGKHYLTSAYGARTVNGKEGFHNGCDFVGGNKKISATDHVTAFESGIVTKAVNDVDGKTPSEGNAVIIDHGNGIKTYYFHLKRGSVTVKKGDAVSGGDIIGYMGNTGNSTGAHLHFGIKINNSWVDPLPYITGEKDLGFTRSKHYLRTLKRGYKGRDVLLLQKLLNLYFADSASESASPSPSSGRILEEDGSYGAKTEAAVKKYQSQNGLDADGVFDKKSWSALLSSKGSN